MTTILQGNDLGDIVNDLIYRVDFFPWHCVKTQEVGSEGYAYVCNTYRLPSGELREVLVYVAGGRYHEQVVLAIYIPGGFGQSYTGIIRSWDLIFALDGLGLPVEDVSLRSEGASPRLLIG